LVRKSILFVSYAYPPTNEVGAMRVVRLCRYLPEYGIDPIVLTVDPRFYPSQDASVEAPRGIAMERTRVLCTPLDFYRRLLSNARSGPASPIFETQPGPSVRFSFARRQILALLQMPDSYWGWYFPAIRKAAEIIRNRKISAIISSGPPWTGHLIARHLKRKFRLPWIADFRDPWMANPWRSIEQLPSWRDRSDHWMESSCLHHADVVTCVTEALRGDFLVRYPKLPKSRFVVVTNGVDGTLPSSSLPRPRSSKVICLHLGALYRPGLRRIDTFCQALVDLVRDGKLSLENFQVIFVGSESPASERIAQQIAPELIQNHCIEFLPRVTRRESDLLLESADVLLIFQGNHRISLPSKFFDYLGTGKPMLAVVEKGALSDMVEKTGSGTWVAPGDPKTISQKLLEILQFPTKTAEEIRPILAQFHFRRLAGEFADLVRGVVSSGDSDGRGQ
jgi:glycosyltransferase involved in cell wall biosynthesis